MPGNLYRSSLRSRINGMVSIIPDKYVSRCTESTYDDSSLHLTLSTILRKVRKCNIELYNHPNFEVFILNTHEYLPPFCVKIAL